MNRNPPNHTKLDSVVAAALQARDTRERGYRDRALRMFPWVCGRCGRGFERAGLHELTVHHRDHNHENNPPDGSNWELLCLYCHDDEHARGLTRGIGEPPGRSNASFKPFENIKDLLNNK